MGNPTISSFLRSIEKDAKLERCEFNVHRGKRSLWAVVDLEPGYHTDRHGAPFEARSSIVYTIIDEESSFIVNQSLWNRFNKVNYTMNPHSGMNPFIAPWGELFAGSFCGAGNISRAPTHAGAIRAAYLQQSRCENGYSSASSRNPKTCDACGKEFYGPEGYGLVVKSMVGSLGEKVCPECAMGNVDKYHFCTRSEFVRDIGIRQCRCTRIYSEDDYNGSAAGPFFRVKAQRRRVK